MKKDKVDYGLEIFGNDVYLDAHTYTGSNPIPNKEGYVWDSEGGLILPVVEYVRKKKIEQRKSKIKKIKNKLKC